MYPNHKKIIKKAGGIILRSDIILPVEKTFLQSFIPYFGPYALYVSIGAIPDTFLAPEIKQIAMFIAVSVTMAWFFNWYRFEKLECKLIGIAVITSPVALFLWTAPLYYLKGHGGVNDFSSTYIVLRTINSMFLVAVFEELFIRVYLMRLFYQAGVQLKAKGFIGSILHTFDHRPTNMNSLPLSYFSVVSVTVLFAAGHTIKEWVSAILYFSFTNYVYKKTGSIMVCILIHGIVNFAIVLMARFGGMGFLWV